MRDKLNRFIDNTIGQFIEVSSSSALYQCMDLAYNWVFCLGFPKATIQNQYAYQVYTNPKEITYHYFDLIPNTSDFIPQDGDIGVFDKTTSNIAGHIVICLGGGTTSKFKRFEQNNPLGTNAHIGEGGYSKFLGVLRPKIQESSVTEPHWFKTLLQEAGLTLENEGAFRIFWEKAIKYDNDIRSLQEQVKSANEALADRALEVSVLTEKSQKLSDAATEAQEQLNKTRSDYATAVSEKQTLQYQFEKLTIENEENQKAMDVVVAELDDLRMAYNALQAKKIKGIGFIEFLRIKLRG